MDDLISELNRLEGYMMRLPSAQSKRMSVNLQVEKLSKHQSDFSDLDAQSDSKVKCLSCGHRIAERLSEVYCNIMCKWVNEKDYCVMFEPGHTMEEFEKEVGDENGS